MFKIYSSSAGSGKTYTLTKEYLKLALQSEVSDDYYRHILAVTFTNAAANEMKNRILDRLEGIAGTEESPLLDQLVEELYGVKPNTTSFAEKKSALRRKAASVFKTILHRYADFSVTTIDSFTQRVVMAFTDELGLPYSFEVELETDEVLERAIDNLIEKAGTEEMDEITTILSEYYTHAAAEGKSWNLLPELLKEFGRNLTSDQFYDAVNAAQELSPSALRAIRSQLMAHNQQVETSITEQGKRAWSLITSRGLDEEQFKGKGRSVAAYFKTIALTNFEKEPTATHRKQLEESDWYLPKTPLTVTGAIDSIADELCNCFDQIEVIRAESNQNVALFDCLLPHLQKLALLKQMRVEFDDLLRKDGRVHISEFNKKILSIVASEPVPFLYERLGTKYNHILIDEFQDTSRLQFANLLPLIENALGANHFNLAVGDGKQAIYRFRGGDMDQIVALHRQDLDSLKRAHKPESWTADRIGMLDGRLERELLKDNWRSAESIVTFNNNFFDFTARQFESQHPKLAEVFDAQQDFLQRAQKTNKTGHVQIDFVDKDDEVGKDLTARMLETTLTYLEKSLADGYQYGDIAILCRKKAHARALANELNARRIPLVSADSLSLEFSDPVKWIITLMRLLQRPDLRMLRYELLYLFHRVVENKFPDNALAETLRTVAESDIDATYAYLTNVGYPLDPYVLGQLNPYELAERLTAQFGLFNQAEHNPFLFRFLDEVLTFNQKRSGHLSDFLLYWDSVQQRISVEGDARNAVSIQTIHKSKGLEFPVVIIPFANWRVEPIHDSTIWLDLNDIRSDVLAYATDTDQPVRLTAAPTNTTTALRNAPASVAAQYEEELTRTFIENMNLLYVAFTRPIDRLYVIGKASDFTNASNRKDVSYWLYRFLSDSEAARNCGCAWEEGRLSYEISLCPDAVSHRKMDESADEIVLDNVVSGHRGQDLQLRRQADRLFDVATFERTRERDRKLCAALSLIKGPGCIDKVLRQLVSEGFVRKVECEALKYSLLAIVSHPALAALFDASLRIDTDRTILSRKRMHGAPHRVVHYPDGRIVLVQYESVASPADMASQTADPAATLRYFTGLYRDMGYPEVEGRLVYLSDEPDVVHVV